MNPLAGYLIPVVFSVSLALFLKGMIDLRPRRRRPTRADAGAREAAAGLRQGTAGLLVRAGRSGELTVRSVVTARFIGAGLLPLLALPVAGLLPGRLGLMVTAGLVALGFIAPNLILERAARKRQERVVASLPDALDLISVQLGAGRTIGSAMRDLAGSGKGPLAFEMGVTADEIARGMPHSAALGRLRQRTGGREMAAFCATVERSRRLGSPLATDLTRQASEARIAQSRAVAERAARAAPKIQLVIALVLVPAVMLLVIAALVANSDRLIGFAFG